jgi:hypothetical protein
LTASYCLTQYCETTPNAYFIKSVIADGYCFFNAIIAIMHQGEVQLPTALELRKDLIALLINDFKKREGLLDFLELGDDRESEYLNYLQEYVTTTYRGQFGDLAIARMAGLFSTFPRVVKIGIKDNKFYHFSDNGDIGPGQ